MQLRRTLTLTACACLLTACAAWVPRDAPPETAAAPCAPPVVLPARALTQREVETWWRADRHALLDCGERLDLLVAFAGVR